MADAEAEKLAGLLAEAHARTLALIDGLSDVQLMGPRLDIVNPFRWEAGHIAWFHEYFALRGLDPAHRPAIAGADALYNSSTVPHDARWILPLPDRNGTVAYMTSVLDAMRARLAQGPLDDRVRYLFRLTLMHEDMHGEAFTYMRQTLAYPAPAIAGKAPENAEAGPHPGDVAVPGGIFRLGSEPGTPFVFDNEKWAHEVRIEPFRIARAPVTNAEFQAFVADNGYQRRELWSEDGWAWRTLAIAEHPIYWIRDGDGWRVRTFDREAELRPHRPVYHVNWHEAEAYCRWANRRLPTEAEWEAAAAGTPVGGTLAPGKRKYPWGEAGPDPARANLDGYALGPVDVAACPAGDSAFGCRQMIGNVWEWTASDFEPYPGFSPDIYADYSQPWFGGTHKVLRGGAWATPGRLANCAYRNFFVPERRDVFAGFRTCVL
ncbi:MAG: ergothioneine biosynthesis protein EgtB [Rhodospirillales bacterium]|nr:ergothioneine biosynthesis protein EgtB [Rhodospirillales bacterium]